MAREVSSFFGKPPFEGFSATVLEADYFSATDILPVYAFFIGCKDPDAFSYLYIDELFEHINMAGRPCGIFSFNPKTIKYVSTLIKASEAIQGKPFLAKDETPDKNELINWVENTLKQGG